MLFRPGPGPGALWSDVFATQRLHVCQCPLSAPTLACDLKVSAVEEVLAVWTMTCVIIMIKARAPTLTAPRELISLNNDCSSSTVSNSLTMATVQVMGGQSQRSTLSHTNKMLRCNQQRMLVATQARTAEGCKPYQ
eukprot:3843005-Rhodomonas_salina.1